MNENHRGYGQTKPQKAAKALISSYSPLHFESFSSQKLRKASPNLSKFAILGLFALYSYVNVAKLP